MNTQDLAQKYIELKKLSMGDLQGIEYKIFSHSIIRVHDQGTDVIAQWGNDLEAELLLVPRIKRFEADNNKKTEAIKVDNKLSDLFSQEVTV